MRYRCLIVEDWRLMTREVRRALSAFADRVVSFNEATLKEVRLLTDGSPIVADAHAGLRVRQLRYDGTGYALLFNEAGGPPADATLLREAEAIDAATGEASPLVKLALRRHELRLRRLRG